ncbi:MAG: hypothetical protein VX460_09885 [Planctomycetota bacterium]|nr:hypothetical protein [Planctomycetota bacterium]
MEWTTRNEGQFWLLLPLALGAAGLLGRLGIRPLTGRLRPFVAILGGGAALVAALTGGDLATARAWAIAPVAAILILDGVASLGSPRETRERREDLLVPGALAVLAVTASSVTGLFLAIASLMAWAGLSGLRVGQRSVGLARIIALASALGCLGLGLQGARLRSAGGASGAIEWLGLPLRGDAGTTAVFVALVVPLLLPGRAGGPTAGLCARDAATRRSANAVLIHLTVIWALQALFGGVEALRTVALAGLGIALLTSVGKRRSAGDRHAGLLQGAAALAVFGAGTGDEGAACGVALALVAHAVGATVVSLAVAKAQALSGTGGARAMPQTTIFAWIAGLSLVGFPFTLGGLATSIGLGSAVRDGAEDWSMVVLIGAAALTGLVLVPLLMGLSDGDGRGDRAAEPRAMSVAVPAAAGLGAAFLVATGSVPGALQFLLPHQGASLAAYPGPAVLAGTIALGAVLGAAVRRALGSR